MLSSSGVLFQNEYPQVPNRYSSLWWNRNYQHCYTPFDENYLQKIRTFYEKLISRESAGLYFDLKEEFQWREWWSCKSPIYYVKNPLEFDGFTLPNRSAKDDKLFPLWNFADNQARHIANLQSMRVKNQELSVMNDPMMLAMEELKNWYFNQLSEAECKHDQIDPIIKRQSYIKQLIHIYQYGMDSIKLHEIERELSSAINILSHCIMQKELPQYLSTLITHAKNFENIIGTYLHFLNVNQEVSDNFSYQYLSGEEKYIKYSPVAEIFHHIYSKSVPNENLLKLPNPKETYTINLPQYAREEDRKIYSELVNLLNYMMQVRVVIEEFREILPKIGTYLFSLNYINQFEALSTHYVTLIEKTQLKMSALIQSANHIFYTILNKDEVEKNKAFVKNFKALEVGIAKDTTMHNQIDLHVNTLKKSVLNYRAEMTYLVERIEQGKAIQEISSLGNNLLIKMADLNHFLPEITHKNIQHMSLPQRTQSSLSQELVEIEGETLHVSSSTKIEPVLNVLSHKAQSFFTHLIGNNEEKEIKNDKSPNHFFYGEIFHNLTLTASFIMAYFKRFPIFSEKIYKMAKNTHMLHEYKEKNKTYSLRYEKLLDSEIKQTNLLEDQFVFIEKNINLINAWIHQATKKGYFSLSRKNEIENKLDRVKDFLINLEIQNDSIKKIFHKIEEMKKLSGNEFAFFKIKYIIPERKFMLEISP